MKPLISLNSCLTVPPCFLALSLALGRVLAERTKSVSEVMYLSISSGEAPCFKVICQGSLSAGMMTHRLQLAACRRTHIIHGRHLEVPGCNGCTKGSAYFEMMDMVFVLSVWLLLDRSCVKLKR